MKSLKALSFVMLAGMATVAMSGCSSAQKGAAGGGVIGGVAGAIIGNNIPASAPATGAAIGVSSGVAVGGLAGDAYDMVNEADSDRELENLRAELAAKESELAALQGKGTLSDAELAQLNDAKVRLGQLESELAQARSAADAANRAAQEAANARNAKDMELAGLRNAADTARARADEEARLRAEREAALAGLQADAEALRNKLTAAEAEKKFLEGNFAKTEAELQALKEKIASKEAALNDLQGKVDIMKTSLDGKSQAMSDLEKQLADMNVKLEDTSRGLTLTIVDSFLYKPGKADLTDSGKKLITDVSNILNAKFPGREMLIEGHTDNQPIVKSGWKTNWELASARSLALLHELVKNHGVDPTLVSAASYGEYRPENTNTTAEGRRANRRAVIVILPEKLPLTREQLASAN